MTQISPVSADNVKSANYNAVKIQINDPQANIPQGFKSSADDNGIYNATNIEVNRPRVNAGADNRQIYSYPEAKELVTYDMAGIAPILPVAYNFINSKTLISTDLGIKTPEKQNAQIAEEVTATENKLATEEVAPEENKITAGVAEEVKTTEEENVEVPKANLTTTEAEKGISFQGKAVEIEPSQEIKPDVDVQKVVSNLSNKDFDVQAQQMEEITRLALEDSKNAIPYVVKEIFMELINVVQKDTSELTPPSPEQIESRKKIIVNEMVKEQARANGENPDKVELPYIITDAEKKSAATLTDMEQAERNKEYALYTMAVLAKVYTDEIFKQTGNVVPMTDLPGISTVVDTLRYNPNSSVKISAIDALRYIKRPEYKDELISLFSLAAKDESPYVARSAMVALASMEE